MKRAIEEIKQIKEYEKQLRQTASIYRKRDLYKCINRKKRDLLEYCKYKHLDPVELWKKADE